MVLPLAPLKRMSSIRMPPAVWVRWASNPPATIRTTPIMANDHLPRIDASPIFPFAVAAAFRFVLFVIDTLSEAGPRTSEPCGWRN